VVGAKLSKNTMNKKTKTLRQEGRSKFSTSVKNLKTKNTFHFNTKFFYHKINYQFK